MCTVFGLYGLRHTFDVFVLLCLCSDSTVFFDFKVWNVYMSEDVMMFCFGLEQTAVIQQSRGRSGFSFTVPFWSESGRDLDLI